MRRRISQIVLSGSVRQCDDASHHLSEFPRSIVHYILTGARSLERHTSCHALRWWRSHSRGPRALFTRWYPNLVRSLRARLGDADLAEDIAQEAFVRVLDREPRDPRAWVYAVAANLVSDHARGVRGRERQLVRHRSASGASPGVGEPGGAADAWAQLVRAEEIARVRAALARIPGRNRVLLLLHHDGLSYAGLAGRFGVAPSSVGPLLVRAQRRLTRTYESMFPSPEVQHARRASR